MKKLLLMTTALVVTCISNAQWTEQATGFSNQSRGLSSIEIVDENIVWAKAYDGITATNVVQEFTRTTDGGATWTARTINIGQPTWTINNIIPVSGVTAWISAVDSNGTNSNFGGIWKTINGGITWVRQNQSAFQSASSYLNGVHFFNADEGVAMGDPIGSKFEIWKTTNGGTSWTQITGSAIPNSVSEEWGYNGSGVVVAGGTLWFTTNKGNIYRTADKGNTWTKLSGPAGFTDFSGDTVRGQLSFSDANNGLILGSLDAGNTFKIWRTSNGGSTWDNGSDYREPYKDLCFIPGTSTIIGTGFTGTGTSRVDYSGYSIDNGVTWTQIDTGVQRTTVAFLDSNTGWASGFNTSATEGGIFKYTGIDLNNEDFNTTQDFSISPNPTNGLVKIYANNHIINQVVIYNLLGEEVFNKSISNYNGETTLDLTSLQTGAYFLKVSDNNDKVQTLKFIKN